MFTQPLRPPVQGRYDLFEVRAEVLHSYTPFLSCGFYIVERFREATPTHSLSYDSFDHIISTFIAVHQQTSHGMKFGAVRYTHI